MQIDDVVIERWNRIFRPNPKIKDEKIPIQDFKSNIPIGNTNYIITDCKLEQHIKECVKNQEIKPVKAVAPLEQVSDVTSVSQRINKFGTMNFNKNIARNISGEHNQEYNRQIRARRFSNEPSSKEHTSPTTINCNTHAIRMNRFGDKAFLLTDEQKKRRSRFN